jgi:flagellar basal body rod protein FlgF
MRATLIGCIALAMVLYACVGCRPTAQIAGGDAWARADRAVRERADVADAIDAAEQVVQLNLRYADTAGFKAVRCEVQDGRPRLTLDMTEGSPDMTNRPLDIAIQGAGFFKVRTGRPGDKDGGIGFTRCGRFFVALDSNLGVSTSPDGGDGTGCAIVPRVNFPKNASDVTIAPDGTVFYTAGSGANAVKQKAGQLQLTNFIDPDRLRLIGGGVYVPTDASGEPMTGNPGDNGTGIVLQGYLERSNVDVTRERLRLDFLHRWREAVVR